MIYWVLYLVGKGGYLMRLSELEFHLEDFLLACQSKNLSPKTLSSYEQSLKLFLAYLKAGPEVVIYKGSRQVI